ncbi:hypothetical protein ACLB2K_076712 [Fragaria x ananassa]
MLLCTLQLPQTVISGAQVQSNSQAPSVSPGFFQVIPPHVVVQTATPYPEEVHTQQSYFAVPTCPCGYNTMQAPQAQFHGFYAGKSNNNNGAQRFNNGAHK